MSKLERISTLIHVVEENGFAAAARKMNVSTAAISRQISGLEEELNVQLLIRTTRQVALTEIGMQYYLQCKKTLRELEETEHAISGSQTEATGILTIMTTRHFALTTIIPRLPIFLAANPKLRIKFVLGERFPNLLEEGIDLLYGVSMDGPPDLIRRRITDTRYVLCASPDYLSIQGTPKTISDLTKHHYIAHSMRRKPNVLSFNHDKEIILEPFLWLNDTAAMQECALQGLGLVYLHDYEVFDALQNGKLIEVLKEFQKPTLPVYLYYLQNKFLLPKIRKFIDFYLP